MPQSLKVLGTIPMSTPRFPGHGQMVLLKEEVCSSPPPDSPSGLPGEEQALALPTQPAGTFLGAPEKRH